MSLLRKVLLAYYKMRRRGPLRKILFKRFGVTLGKPKVVHFELTNNCNLSCEFCEREYVWRKRRRGYMDFELFKKGIDEVAEWGVPSVQLNRFGESTLHDEFPRFIEYAKRKGIPEVHVISNATLMDKELSRKVIKAGLDRIAFSFEGSKKETYENIMKGATFEESKKNIERFIDIRNSLGKTKPIVQLNTVLNKNTEDEIENVKDMWKDKVDRINVQDFLRKEGTPDLSAEKSNSDKIDICTAPAEKLIVFWNGKVVPCCTDSFGDLVMGDLNEGTLKEIWNGQEISKLRRRLLNKNLEGLTCNSCPGTNTA